jgi:hypothetical protein
MNKLATAFALCFIAFGIYAGVAGATRPHHPGDWKPKPVAGFICSDNGTTIPVQDLAKALKMFPDAKSGPCPETPPVEPPPVINPTGGGETPPPVLPIVLPSGPAGTFLCISHNDQTVPSFVDWGQVLNWLGEGDFVPMAVPVSGLIDGQDVLQTPTGFFKLVCGLHKGAGVGIGDGVGYDAQAWQTVLATYGPVHPNFYELAS